MNRFFEFSQAQIKTLSVLAVIVVLGAGYKFVRDYYLRPSQTPHRWRVEDLNDYRPTLVLDLNFSPADSLELIPGIGPVLAERIVDYRLRQVGFSSVDSLINVAGIGRAKLGEVRGFFKVSPR